LWYFQPTSFGRFSAIIQPHFPIHNFAKQTLPVVRAYGNKIRTRLRIIVIFQPYGTAVVFFGVVFHLENLQKIFIVVPFHRIVCNILSYAFQFRFIANDVFVIIALPNGMYIGLLPKPFGNTDFKPTDNGPDGA